MLDRMKAIAEARLHDRQLTLIDDVNAHASDRRVWIDVARRWHAPPIAIVLDPGVDICIARSKSRIDWNSRRPGLKGAVNEIRQGLDGLSREGFHDIWKLSSVEAVERTHIERHPLPGDRRDDHGPFDIIGDVHGCADELEALLSRLGYALTRDGQKVEVGGSAWPQARLRRRSRRSRAAHARRSAHRHGGAGGWPCARRPGQSRRQARTLSCRPWRQGRAWARDLGRSARGRDVRIPRAR